MSFSVMIWWIARSVAQCFVFRPERFRDHYLASSGPAGAGLDPPPVGDGLGSGFGSIGIKSVAPGVAVAIGAGGGTGDSKRPLFVINFPSRERMSSTRYRP